MIDSDTCCKYWSIVVDVTIPFQGCQWGQSKIMLYFTFDSSIGKVNKILCLVVSAPQRLIVMIDSYSGCKYWYIVVAVTISFKGFERGLSKILLNLTFDSSIGKLNKILCLVVLPQKDSLS